VCLPRRYCHCMFVFDSNDFHFELGVGKANKLYVPTVVKRESQETNEGFEASKDTACFAPLIFKFSIPSLQTAACKMKDDSSIRLHIFELTESLVVWLLPHNRAHLDVDPSNRYNPNNIYNPNNLNNFL
jgi:hypothetical protein